MSRRLFNHIVTKSKFIDTSVQKGCMEGTPGCWEHISMVWASLKAARKEKKSVSNIWLDIANAYGSIPHDLIFLHLNGMEFQIIVSHSCALTTPVFGLSTSQTQLHLPGYATNAASLPGVQGQSSSF